MKKTIIIENDKHLSSLYELNLNLWLNCDVVRFKEAKFALDYIKKNKSEISLIICKRRCGLEKTSLAIKNFLISSSLKLPLIVLGEETIINNKECTINFSDIKSLIQCSASYLKITAQEMANLDVPDFYPISLRNFCFIEKLPTPVFKKSQNGFDLIFDKKVNRDELLKLKDKKEEKLYVKKENRLKFISLITQEYLIQIISPKESA